MGVAARPILVTVLALLAAACAAPAPRPDPATGGGLRFQLGADTFAFANLVRAERPGLNDGFANYCLVMARAASQFYRFARFAPASPRASAEEYATLVRLVLERAPWEPPASDPHRVVIPGYPDLHAFSRGEEALVKAAFGSNVASMVHWRTWRVGVALSARHQARVAEELLAEVKAGRPAPLMITNFPHADLLNHAVLVYDHREASGDVEFLAYDPNDPGTPLAVRFHRAEGRFWVAPLPYSPPGPIRAFRVYVSPLL
jgi:hypothetical protein